MAVLDDKDNVQTLEEIIEGEKGRSGAVMTTLQKAQDAFGYVPQDVQAKIADGLGTTLSEVYGVATFYSQFSLEPRGEYLIGVCLGTACYVKRAQAIFDRVSTELGGVQSGKTTEDQKFTLQDTRCLGCCGLAPVMMINDDVHSSLTPDRIPGILKKYQNA